MTDKSDLVIDVPMVEVLPTPEDPVRQASRRAINAGRLRQAFGIVASLATYVAFEVFDAKAVAGIIGAVGITGYLGLIVVENDRDGKHRDAVNNRSRQSLYGSNGLDR